jgi:glucokinase
MKLLGIDIGGTKTSVGLGDESGKILASHRFPTEPPRGIPDWMQRTLDVIHRLLREQGWPLDGVDAVGLACPGPMSVKDGMMLKAPNMQGWENIPFQRLFSDALRRPVYINNDANACAQAEWLFGSCKGAVNLVYLTMSTGVGAGIIVNGQLVQGTNDLGGEVGHHVLDIHGPPCPCGQRGCFEIYCGGMNVANRLRERVVRERVRTAILDEAGGDLARIDFKAFVGAVRKQDAFALAAWDEYLERLAQALGTIIMMLNPQFIILGTIAIHAGDLILGPVQERLPRYAWKESVAACRIMPSALDTRIGDLSALAVALCPPIPSPRA